MQPEQYLETYESQIQGSTLPFWYSLMTYNASENTNQVLLKVFSLFEMDSINGCPDTALSQVKKTMFPKIVMIG